MPALAIASTLLLVACGEVGGGDPIDAPTPTHTLTVVAAGNGSGTTTSAPAGITCGSDCSEAFSDGTVVTLTAAPATGSSFVGWTGGGCTGTGPCSVTIASDVSVTATYALDNTLTVTRAGNGTGTVTSSPAGITCGADCDEVYPSGTSVTLTAAAGAGSTFGGWSGGGCTGTGTCTVTLTAAVMVTATFTVNQSTLTVITAGNGQGVVTSSPAGITCGADCSEAYDNGTVVTLTATPAIGSTFAGWSGGGCSGTGACTVTVNAATAVTATFTNNPTIAVARSGTGTGTVTSAPAGINCGADCTESYNVGTTVVLTATPATGSVFTGWSGGGCTGTGLCSIGVSSDVTITATFTLQQFTLTVAKTGTGTGTVTSAPAGISCGADCSEIYNFGTAVTLTATPAMGSTFAGWSGGGCTGTGACTTTIAAATTVTAAFTLQQFTLTVVKAGTGTGTVTSAPAGISCGADCSEPYNFGTTVTLTATPATGSVFAGWTGGGCTGTGTCVTTISAATTVTATFTLQQFTLTVARAGTGTGGVTSSPAGITCGADCTEPYNFGTSVTLTAVAGSGSVFAGWTGGGCTGTGTCTTTITAAVTVTATFNMAMVCDTFTIADTTTIPGWTERAGDWVVAAGRLRDSTGTSGTIYSRHITNNASNQTDGCVRFTAVYSGAGTIASAGAILRWTPPMNYVVALVQDNTSAGNWNSSYIYQYPGVTDIGGGNVTGAFGTTTNVEACLTGSAVTMRIDANADGSFETTHTGTTTLTGAGLGGIMTLSASSAVDNFCYGP